MQSLMFHLGLLLKWPKLNGVGGKLKRNRYQLRVFCPMVPAWIQWTSPYKQKIMMLSPPAGCQFTKPLSYDFSYYLLCLLSFSLKHYLSLSVFVIKILSIARFILCYLALLDDCCKQGKYPKCFVFKA